MAAEETNVAVAQSGGKGKLIALGGAGLLLLAIGIFAGPRVMNMVAPSQPDESTGQSAAEVHDSPPIYQSLHPPLVVNFKDEAGDSHFMQITMEVMSREQSVINAVRENAAVIRNALILLYGSAVYETVATRDGKQAMLDDGLAEIERVLVETTGAGGVEALYFTALVIQ